MLNSGLTLGKWNINVYTNDGKMYTKSEAFLISQDFAIGEWGISLDAFELYPNPASAMLTLNFSQNVNSDLEIKIMDISGKGVNQPEYQVKYDSKNIKVDVSTLPKGTYVIQLIYRNTVLSSQKWTRN